MPPLPANPQTFLPVWQTRRMDDNLDGVLAAVGPRLRTVRLQRGRTLADVSAETGISVSTLSRLESGQRRPTLELLLALARAYEVQIDELVPPRTARNLRGSLALTPRPS